MSFIKFNKWFLFSVTGILSLSSGLCIFGEALNLKNSGEAWFLFGTLSLILINAGVCLMIGANYKK
ncbi:hypothetical protein N8978_01740 [Flavobacteriaceae bacterium]|jgi:hypothetical protein|nr:hypothetical protein [Flavobacteriaceae bacterium]|tara:strand:- start:42 stop:239 length:198 start_codon:yes stop_codon:yes gene_type:complete